MPGGRRQYHWRRRPVVNYRKTLLLCGPQASCPQWAPKELKTSLTLIKNGFHLHQNFLKGVGVGGWGSAPDPPIARESALGACQSDMPSWKWCQRNSKMGSIHTQMLPKALATGAPPQTPPTPHSKGERFRRLSVWHVELKMVLKLFKNGFHLHPNTPKSVGGWGSAPDPPPIATEIAFSACQSDSPGVRGANSHLRPGRQKPSVRHW